MHKSSFEKMRVFTEEYLGHLKDEKLRILDLGSQDVNGSYRPLFNNKNWEYIGADMAEGANVDMVLPDAYDWKGIKPGYFDVVISGQVFEHVEFYWVTMLEIVRVLKDNGLCCIIAPSGGPEHKYPADCWRFYPDGFRALARFSRLEVLDAYTQWEPSGLDDGSDIWKDTVLIARKPVLSRKARLMLRLRRRMSKFMFGGI